MNKEATKALKKKQNKKWLTVFVVIASVLAIAVLINMAMIFMFSQESKEESGDRSTGVTAWIVDLLYPENRDMNSEARNELLRSTQRFVRKLAHFAEFALLGFLSTGLLCYLNRWKHKLKTWFLWLIPAAFCLLYAIFDEVHQIFSNRGPSVVDVLIDFSGALFGILLMQGIVGITRGIRRARKERRCKRQNTV